jgi:hypothetical protein
LRLRAGHRGLPELFPIRISNQAFLFIVQIHYRYSHPGTMASPRKITRKKPCVPVCQEYSRSL